MNMFEQDSLLTEKEAAEILGVTQRFMANRRYRKQPPRFVRIGRLVRYSRQAIVEFMQNSTVVCNA